MNEKIKQLLARIDALALRERALLLIAVLFVMGTLWNLLLMKPLTAEQDQLTGQAQGLRQQVAKLEQQSKAVMANHAGDPNREDRARLAVLKTEIAGVDKRLAQLTLGLIQPTQMVKVLEELLTRETDLKLIRMKNLGASALMPASAATKPETEAAEAGLYKHGLVIEFEGSYLSALRYLQTLEALPWKLFWDSVELKMGKYPVNHVTITVHTLSLKEGWIGV